MDVNNWSFSTQSLFEFSNYSWQVHHYSFWFLSFYESHFCLVQLKLKRASCQYCNTGITHWIIPSCSVQGRSYLQYKYCRQNGNHLQASCLKFKRHKVRYRLCSYSPPQHSIPWHAASNLGPAGLSPMFLLLLCQNNHWHNIPLLYSWEMPSGKLHPQGTFLLKKKCFKKSIFLMRYEN